jgi:CRP-like cAMP-binding protein
MGVLEQQISRSRAINTLKKLPVFRGLLDDEYDHILGISQICHYEDNVIIFHEGDPSQNMFILLSGEIEISTKKNGAVCIMKPGDIFGEIGVISQVMRTASAKVRDDAILLEISKERLDLLLGKHPVTVAKILKNLCAILADRLINSNKSSSVI